MMDIIIILAMVSIIFSLGHLSSINNRLKRIEEEIKRYIDNKDNEYK